MDKETNPLSQEQKPGLRDLIKIHDFRNLWIGQVISNFGDSMTSLALMLLVNHLTGSTAALATMMIVMAVPSLTFGMIAGVYVDRLDRKKIMVFSDLLRGLFVLGFLFVDSAEHIWILYVIAFLQASIGTFFAPARSALIPNIVSKDNLLAANSISETSRIIFMLLGTGAAGALIGFFDGYSQIFIIDALTFFISLVMITRIRYTAKLAKVDEKINAEQVFSELKAGLKITFTNRVLTGSLIGIAVTMLGLGAVNVLLVPLIINELQVKETWFAAIEFSQTVSMIFSGSLIAVLATRFKPTNIFAASLVGVGIGVGLMALVGNVWHVMGTLFLVGWFIPPVNAASQTITQTAVPDEVRGRTGAARSALVNVANLISMGAAGILAEAIGTRNVFVVGGLFVVFAGLLARMIFRGVEIPSPKTALAPSTD